MSNRYRRLFVDVDTVRRGLCRFQQHHDDLVRRGETCFSIGENLGVAVANMLLARIKRKERRDASR
jgi:hypothetical protein